MNKRHQLITAIILLCGYVQLFLFDYCYTLNWFGVNDTVYLKSGTEVYTVGELLVNMDEYILLIAVSWVVKRACYLITWMKYFTAFTIDIFIAGIYFCIAYNPYFVNWNKTYWIAVATVVFVTKLILNRHSAWFRKMHIL
jgi:hypothetical protein